MKLPTCRRRLFLLSLVALTVVSGRTLAAADVQLEQAEILFDGEPAPPSSAAVCGFRVVAGPVGPQLALMDRGRTCIVSVQEGEQVCLAAGMRHVGDSVTVTAEATLVHGDAAEVSLSLDESHRTTAVVRDRSVQLELSRPSSAEAITLRLTTSVKSGEAGVRWRGIRLIAGGRAIDMPVSPASPETGLQPPPALPVLRESIEKALIEWDWRMQDGIDTPRVTSTYAEAIQRTLQRGDALIGDLQASAVPLDGLAGRWHGLWREYDELSSAAVIRPRQWEDLWRRVHGLRREIAFRNPLTQVGPLVFVKQSPASFSHQLTQYLGRFARPGGGIFVLDRPGRSMQCRQLAAGQLPMGSFQHPEVAYDGRSVLFAYCPVETAPPSGIEGNRNHHFHLYEMAADGTRLRQLTSGPYDDFSPRYLPNGQILFVSTRRGGWHRCGGRPGQGCENYTLAISAADGSRARPLSYHETQEWDPAVLHDGRVVYTRWDYVDRHAVYYEQLWCVRPDGTAPSIFYGNNTFNPVGIWEPRPVPGSTRVMATAAAHHAMTAGSIILVDVTQGVDGPAAITRLTPDALFPESETRIPPQGWHAPAGVSQPPPLPLEAQRWPGHCYRTAYPLSEKYFLAAYSFQELIGEPAANPVNMFGIYLVDAFGNKELLYRDPNIASLWPTPLRARRRPARLGSMVELTENAQGTFLVHNVYAAWPPIPPGSIKRLRVVQVLPKTTPGINHPTVGLANASPGKQVLGTVPVEADGSAHFRAPAGIPLSFQALDEQGRAVQIMRSLTYLQPGEVVSCVGCHERRTTAPPAGGVALASLRPPSEIQPGPDGSNPFSYPILVQPVLDKHCTRCHNDKQPDGGVVLTGEPEGRYTRSYHALAPRVTYSAWGGRPGDFREVNSEPLTQPGHFGALSSSVMKLILEGHQQVVLSRDEIERLATWMDANALFYGTFDMADQQRQQRGERIAGPKLQ